MNIIKQLIALCLFTSSAFAVGPISGNWGVTTTPGIVDPATYGAKLDAVGANDGAITNATTTVTSALLTSASNGKTCVVRGAGASSGTLIGTLSACSAGSCTISVASGHTVTGARIIVGTDDTAAWQAALNACPSGATVDAGPKYRSLVRQLNIPDGAGIGTTRGIYDPQSDLSITAQGPTMLIIEDVTTPAFTMNSRTHFGDLILYSVSQLAPLTSSTPVAYAPFINIPDGTIVGCYIGKPYLANPYIGIHIEGGRHRIDFVKIGAIARGVVVDHVYDWVDIGTIEHQIFYNICEGTGISATGFQPWAQANCWSVWINRADSISIQQIVAFQTFGTLLLNDSPDTGISPRGSYGHVGRIDADSVSYGIYAISTTSVGFFVDNMIVGSFPGQSAVTTVGGGTNAPIVVIKSWSTRGTFGAGKTANGAGTIIVPSTDPG